MIKEFPCTPEDRSIDFEAIKAEIERTALNVNYMISVNGSSAFPMPTPPDEKQTFRKRLVSVFTSH